jgi:hypothetical protein
MVQRTYTTTMPNAEAFFESLRPARAAIQTEQRRFRPFGAHYNMLAVIIAGMDAAAEFFTRNRAFYALGDSARVGPGPLSEA